MRGLALTLLLLLNACGSVPFQFVKARDIAEVRSADNCGRDVIPNFGCWRPISAAGGCKIMVVWPRDTGDTANLTTLGKEVWKCAEGNKEY